MYCDKCGKEISEGSKFCPECGGQVGSSSQAPSLNQTAKTRDQIKHDDLIYPKNPPLSPHIAWLALFQIGLPHIIFGQVAKGIVLIIISYTILFLLTIFAPFLIPILCIIAIIDVYKIANTLKAGIPVEKWAWFPYLKEPKMQFSLWSHHLIYKDTTSLPVERVYDELLKYYKKTKSFKLVKGVPSSCLVFHRGSIIFSILGIGSELSAKHQINVDIQELKNGDVQILWEVDMKCCGLTVGENAIIKECKRIVNNL